MNNKLPKFFHSLGRFSWTVHNLIAHPVMEVLYQLGLDQAAEWVHDVTIPDGLPDRFIVSYEGNGGTRWLVNIQPDGATTAVTRREDATPLTRAQLDLACQAGYPGLVAEAYVGTATPHAGN